MAFSHPHHSPPHPLMLTLMPHRSSCMPPRRVLEYKYIQVSSDYCGLLSSLYCLPRAVFMCSLGLSMSWLVESRRVGSVRLDLWWVVCDWGIRGVHLFLFLLL